ncbi:hypothetical protein J3459_006142 [Metarhizium acridum]|nr:hypothetical protein J3459_006142 [Metarhizium acridum]
MTNSTQMQMPIRPADAIFCLCSFDTRVAQRAAQLYLDGLAPILIFSGDSGKLTEGRSAKTEAETFADIARGMGVPDDKIAVERLVRAGYDNHLPRGFVVNGPN